MQLLTDPLKGKPNRLVFTDSARDALAKLKHAVSNITSLSYLELSASMALVTDASGAAIAACTATAFS